MTHRFHFSYEEQCLNFHLVPTIPLARLHISVYYLYDKTCVLSRINILHDNDRDESSTDGLFAMIHVDG